MQEWTPVTLGTQAS